MKQLLVVFAAFLLTCITASSQSVQESWGKQIFGPSSATDQRACERGKLRGNSQQNPETFGELEFKAKQGYLLIYTRGGQLYSYCYAIGLALSNVSIELSPVFRTIIRIEDAAVKRENIKVEVSLEREGNEIARLTESETETEDSDKTWYSFRRLNQNQLAALEQTTSFTIIINRGLGEERYAVNPTSLPGL
jgi:hypothetical protein